MINNSIIALTLEKSEYSQDPTRRSCEICYGINLYRNRGLYFVRSGIGQNVTGYPEGEWDVDLAGSSVGGPLLNIKHDMLKVLR